MPWIEMLVQTESLQGASPIFLRAMPDEVDLVDLLNARLAIPAVVAEEGVELKGDNTLP
ncbi:MAG: hypothetical protein ACXV8I_01105 [Methylobacter sp.]